jgi:hypothetical protein
MLSTNDFAGRVVLVTGAGSGIGREAARSFAARGGLVYAADLNEHGLAETVDLIAEIGGKARALLADVAIENQVADAIARIGREAGRLDVAFNNAGITGQARRIEDYPTEDFDRVIAVNLRSVFLGMKHELPLLRRNGGGAIVNTASVAALTGPGGMSAYADEPVMVDGELGWTPAPAVSGDDTMLRPVSNPFLPDGGMRLVDGNLGRGTFKTSAVDAERWTIEAPCRVFDDQEGVAKAFKAGELDKDVIVVVRFQGPRANGMPELHKLTPPLGVLQDRGHKVALVTDGRMSGASGKVPAAIHVTPEAFAGGPLAYLRDGDIVRLSAEDGTISTTADLSGREPAPTPPPAMGTGRELFAMFRINASSAEHGGSSMLEVAGL